MNRYQRELIANKRKYEAESKPRELKTFWTVKAILNEVCINELVVDILAKGYNSIFFYMKQYTDEYEKGLKFEITIDKE